MLQCRSRVRRRSTAFIVSLGFLSLTLSSLLQAQPPQADLSKVSFRMVRTNGIDMHIAEQGEGPLVVLCHGFPESWYSWRHQIPALANAGYHVVAPDQRGYGKTEKPKDVDKYSIFRLTGDIVGLVKALGEEQAIIIGHDWGAPVAWDCSLLRPDIFKATVLLSVPYSPRVPGEQPPLTAAKQQTPAGQVFYQVFFQQVGAAEAYFETDVRQSIRMALYQLSGTARPEHRWKSMLDSEDPRLTNHPVTESFHSWISEDDIDFYTRQFKASGFRGGLNWYRNIDRNWELTAALDGQQLTQPTLFIAGEFDVVAAGFRRQAYDDLEQHVPNLKSKTLLPGVGHWVQQEAPAKTNQMLIEFLNSINQ